MPDAKLTPSAQALLRALALLYAEGQAGPGRGVALATLAERAAALAGGKPLADADGALRELFRAGYAYGALDSAGAMTVMLSRPGRAYLRSGHQKALGALKDRLAALKWWQR